MKSELQIGRKLVKFDYNIKEIVEYGNEIIILLEIPHTDNELNNIYSYNKNGIKSWRVDIRFDEYGIKNKLPFEMIRIIDEKLFASDFYGRRFEIDLKTGISKAYDVVK